MSVQVVQRGTDKGPNPGTTFVTVDINENQRLRLVLAKGDGVRMPLSVEWQRRPSDRYSWDGPNAERQSLGHVHLDTGTFEVRS